MGAKRAAALGRDELVACVDSDHHRAREFATTFGSRAVSDIAAALKLKPDIVVVATTHDALAATAVAALGAGAHVLVEKPAGRNVREVDAIAEAASAAGRLVKVGFNHRFHPGIGRAVELATSGDFGEVMYVRGRYGHGGRLGYEKEWRASPELSGGGELLDQGMHLLDLCHWILGPLPMTASLLRTNFWEMDVEDNAAILLGERDDRHGPWATLHVSWTEWKNEFVLEVYCRNAKVQVHGLGGSYGPEILRVYRMSPKMGPPTVEEVPFPPEDLSWSAEWEHFRGALAAGAPAVLLGDLASARYGLEIVEAAYERDPVADTGAGGGCGNDGERSGR
jgi:predicted dehydrogenase